MSEPDFEGVVAAHQRKVDPAGSCTCGGWPVAPNDAPWTAHLSAALHAELASWLRDERTREVVADRVGEYRPAALTGAESGALYDAYRFGDDGMTFERVVEDVAARVVEDTLTAALAALTATDQEDHR